MTAKSDINLFGETNAKPSTKPIQKSSECNGDSWCGRSIGSAIFGRTKRTRSIGVWVQFPAFIIRAAIEPPAYICSVPSPRIIAPAHCRGRFTKEHALRAGVPWEKNNRSPQRCVSGPRLRESRPNCYDIRASLNAVQNKQHSRTNEANARVEFTKVFHGISTTVGLTTCDSVCWSCFYYFQQLHQFLSF